MKYNNKTLLDPVMLGNRVFNPKPNRKLNIHPNPNHISFQYYYNYKVIINIICDIAVYNVILLSVIILSGL